MDNCSPNDKGLTLIGVVIALFLLTAASFSLTRILIARKDVTGLGRERLVAASIAREGLELVRALRDNNWLKSDSLGWTDIVCDDDEFTVDAETVREQNPLGFSAHTELFIKDNGEWVHDPGAGRSAGYHRTMAVDCSQAAGDPEVITVTATVSWTSREENHAITIQEKMFNWFLPEEESP